ncbi:YdiU/UPF0061 family uncharacterized protein [Serratia fonticola]|jgi:hypothetical protein|uniref:YdiU/UPF0061 family uncharacterized protein n=1 Tax=Serratia fonticola TaxID=47917 RepID=A0A559T6Y2_SERFO|nr:YdiU/UPF0061 family uncharacterized protein [Serratia fonticola]TQI95870.1 YdiU/UPF0061 family uncharacterized protein [Serratia fonticola]TVZ70367.1 YdiU/UPF0061 family uncharacterized protein [Serratia fonticola]
MDANLLLHEPMIPRFNGLPTHSYIAFKTVKLAAPELVWLNPVLNNVAGMSESALLEAFAYVTPDYMPPSGLDARTAQYFLADRYGSRYEACNGGSARCGIRQGWQVKGIGRNPLVAVNIDSDHTHGKLCLIKAIAEAVWGEICHRELPYGAIRTLAIIKTGAWMVADYGLPGSQRQPCALVVREIAIRPAHFERATFFWPEPGFLALRDDDARRVQQAVEALTSFLPAGDKGLFAGLACFVERMACQIAVSRIKGIPHGSLTSSNIAIDGRFLDFGTMSAVPDFANYVLAAGQGGVWDDHRQIAEWLRHIALFINKYHPEGLDRQQLNTLTALFYARLESEENRACALQVGLQGSEAFLIAQGSNIKQALRAGKSQPRALHGFDNSHFIGQLEKILQPLGIAAASSMFPLRSERFSLYTLTRAIAQAVAQQGAGRDAIDALIADYTSPEPSDA